MNGAENGVTQNSLGHNGVTQNGRYGVGQTANGHQNNIVHDEDRPESVQSNDSMCSGSFLETLTSLQNRAVNLIGSFSKLKGHFGSDSRKILS